jgi:hypothetical protein
MADEMAGVDELSKNPKIVTCDKKIGANES